MPIINIAMARQQQIHARNTLLCNHFAYIMRLIRISGAVIGFDIFSPVSSKWWQLWLASP